MAIPKYGAVPPPPESPPLQAVVPPQSIPHHAHSASGTLDIESWTISALESLSVSPVARGAGGTPLSIPLDHSHASKTSVNGPLAGQSSSRVTIAIDGEAAATTVNPPRRPPSRRDSMRRREALLKGKEGSRRRRKWDMARLTDVPNVEPPLPSDWEPRPVYPIHHIPYHIAQYWDRGLRQQVEEKDVAARKKKVANSSGKVPRDLRETVKRTPGVKGWVRALEEHVRQFLIERGAGGEVTEVEDESDVSDDEVVFVGRKGIARDDKRDGWKRAHGEVHDRPIDQGMIFDSLEDDESGAFRRWLTHSISGYYGLDSRSVTMGDPVRRCVYVGIREVDVRRGTQAWTELPRPLWEHF